MVHPNHLQIITDGARVINEQIQRKAFELGYSWGIGGQEIQFLDATAIFLGPHKKILQTNSMPAPLINGYRVVSIDFLYDELNFPGFNKEKGFYQDEDII